MRTIWLDPCWPFWFPICLLNLKAARVPISTEQLPRPHGSRSVRKTSPSPLSNVWLALNDIRRDILEMPGCDQDSRENIVGEHYARSPSPPPPRFSSIPVPALMHVQRKMADVSLRCCRRCVVQLFACRRSFCVSVLKRHLERCTKSPGESWKT